MQQRQRANCQERAVYRMRGFIRYILTESNVFFSWKQSGYLAFNGLKYVLIGWIPSSNFDKFSLQIM